MRTVCIFACLACVLPGQDRERKTVAGQVVDLRGKDVQSASVTLVHRPIGWCREYGDPDIVVVTADDKGQFRAKLLPERPYSAYATWGTQTAPVVSAPLEHVTAGAFITLREQHTAIVSLRIRVDGQERWRDLGPLGFRVAPHLANLAPIRLAANEDGTITIPPLPGSGGKLEVTTKEGHTLWSSRLSRGREERKGIAQRSEGSSMNLQVLSLPAPVEIPILVVDAASGEPVAGAEIRHRSGWHGYRVTSQILDTVRYSLNYWRPLRATDAKGEVAVRVPAAGSPWPTPGRRGITLAVRAKGYAEAFAGWSSGKQFFDQQRRSENPKPLRIPLKPQRPVTGRLTLDGTRPASNLRVMLWMEVRAYLEGGGGWGSWEAPLQFATTDAKGNFRFPFAPRGRSPLLIGIPLDRKGVADRLRIDGLKPMLLGVAFAEKGTRGASGQHELQRELGSGSLGAEDATVISLRDRHGNPVRGAEVFVLPPKLFSDVIAVRNTTDGSGRCVIFPAEEGHVAVTVLPDRGYAIQLLPGQRKVTMTLEPFAHVEGKVIWNDGKPVCGGSAYSRGTSHRAAEFSDQEKLLRRIAIRISKHIAKGTSDRSGRFRIPYIPARGVSLRVCVTALAGTQWRTGEFLLDCDPDREQEPIEVKLVR